MMKKALLIAAAGMLMGATFGTPASAAYIAPITLEQQHNANIVDASATTTTTVVKHKRANGSVVTRRTTTRHWTYDPHRHGARYRHRSGVHKYYYNGYYYERPWWGVGVGVPGVNLCIGC